MAKNACVSGHPRMDITLEFSHDLRLVKFLREFHSLNGHPQIKFLILRHDRMDIMKCGVTIHDLNRLYRLNSKNTRDVPTSFLIQNNGIFGRIKNLLPEALFHINEYIF